MNKEDAICILLGADTMVDLEQQFILERLGCPIYYWVGDADGPTVVLMHGAGADNRMFDPNMSAFAGRYRTIRLDVRGHGHSRPIGERFSLDVVVDDLMAILDRHASEPVIVVGQSMGGNVAQELVRRHPERVNALVLVDCACNTFQLSLTERLGVIWTPVILQLYPYESLLRISARASAIQPAVRHYLYDTMRGLGKDDLHTVLAATTAVLRDDPAYRIPCPFLLIRGEHDRTGAIAKQAPLWAEREPLCRYEVIPNAGHCANQDNPVVFNQLLATFLQEQHMSELAD